MKSQKAHYKLHEEIRYGYEHYEKEVRKYSEEAKMTLGKLNGEISGIISIRLSLYDNEIRNLYNALSLLGNIGEKITPFDYSPEIFQSLSGFSPIAIGKKGFDIKEYERLWLWERNDWLLSKEKEFNEIEGEYQKELRIMKNFISFCKQATVIAELYRVCILSIKEAINTHIIRELQGVCCFFYADGVRENIQEEKGDKNIGLLPLEEYKDTLYHKHYLFVKNTLYYYKIVCEFFSSPILTNIIKDKKVTREQTLKMNEKIDEIRISYDKVKYNAVFVEGK